VACRLGSLCRHVATNPCSSSDDATASGTNDDSVLQMASLSFSYGGYSIEGKKGWCPKNSPIMVTPNPQTSAAAGAARAGLGFGLEPLEALVRGHANDDGDAAGLTSDVLDDLGLAEVTDLDIPVGVHMHVVGVHVEVRDAVGMDVRKRLEAPRRSLGEGWMRDVAPAAFVEDAAERVGVHKLEHVRDHSIFEAAEDCVVADDVRAPGGPARCLGPLAPAPRKQISSRSDSRSSSSFVGVSGVVGLWAGTCRHVGECTRREVIV
jgi:hypothetical protein